MARYFVDCRSMPSESNCSLYISGERDEVIEAASQHAISVHQHDDTQELRDEIAGAIQEERQAVGVAVPA